MPGNREKRFEPMGVADPNMILNVNVPETVQKQAREWRRGTRKRLFHSGRSVAYLHNSFPYRYDSCFRSRGQRLWDQPREVKQHLAGKGRQESETPYPRPQHLPGASCLNDMVGDKGVEMMTGSVKDDCQLRQPQPYAHHPLHPHHQTSDPRKSDSNEQLLLHHYQNQIAQREDHMVRGHFKRSRACLRLIPEQEPLISRFFEPTCELSTEGDSTLAGRTTPTAALGSSKKTEKEESQKEEEMRHKYCRSFMIEDSNSKKTSKHTCTASKKRKNDFPSTSKSPKSQPTCCVEPRSYFDKEDQTGANDKLMMSSAAKSASTDPHSSRQRCGGSGNCCLQYRCSSPATPLFRGRSRCLRKAANHKVSSPLTGHEHIIQRNGFGESVLGHRRALEASGSFGCTQDDLEVTCSRSANSSNTPDGTVDDITALSVAETVDFFLNMTSPLSGSDSEDSMDFPQTLGFWHLQGEVFT